MECSNRRGRRGRYHSQMMMPHSYAPPNSSKPWSLVSGLYSFLIMSCLIALIYMMLDYHCTVCSSKCNLSNITRNIEDIAQHLATMKDNYNELETKILQFSQELPKIEGQIEVLEALASTIEKGRFGWDPKSHTYLPNVDVFLNSCAGDQFRKNCTNRCHRAAKVKAQY